MDKTLKAFLKSQDLHPKQLYKLAPGTLIEEFLKFQKAESKGLYELNEWNGSPLPGHGSVFRRFYPNK